MSDVAAPGMRLQRLVAGPAGVLAGLVLLLALWKLAGVASDFPAWLRLDVQTPVDSFADWVSATFRFLLKPLSDSVKTGLKAFDDFVLGLPWLVIVTGLCLLALSAGGLRLALLTAATLVLMGCLGLWESGIKTLDIMVVSVLLTLAVSIPLGIWSARSDRVEAILRPILDAMQTMPTFVYLIPVMLLFGIGGTSAVFATVVYAAPPAIRLTNLGLRQVSADVVEASRSFGSTYLQELFMVRLPLARPAIMMGVNQAVMMALGMVIFVALIGSDGLGKDIWFAMRRLKIGNALEAGTVVVLIAIVLDRFGYALTRSHGMPGAAPAVPSSAVAKLAASLHGAAVGVADHACGAVAGCVGALLLVPAGATRAEAARRWLQRHPVTVLGTLTLVVLLACNGWLIGIGSFPKSWRINVAAPIDIAVRWLNINLAFITDPVRTYIYILGLGPAKDVMLWLPWLVIVLAVCMVAWYAGRWRVATLAVTGMLFIGLTGMWELTMITIAQVAVALVLSLVVALPLGVLAAKSDRFDMILRPLLDTMQTLPAFVYFPVIVMLFKVGDLAGIIATVIYAMPPAVRLTSLGIREVSPTVREAALSYGSTPGQLLAKVELPLALPSIMMGINQTTIMALAMVVYAALIGAKGLGGEVLVSIGRFDVGGGFVAGTSIVFLAIILDRITQGFASTYRRSLGG